MSYSVNTNTEEEIAVDNSIPYEMIRIEVLDCRSGRPLANKQVKKLVIYKDDDQAIIVDFDKDDGQEPVDSYRTALSRLGFNEELQKDRYINYWQSRAEGTTVLDGDEPIDDFTARIIEEYNLHRATDANGILNLQIPRNFFNGHAVSIEVGFWDFPVFLEAIIGDSRTQAGNPPRQPLEPIRRNESAPGLPDVPENTTANGTQFNIVWTGRQQSTEWNGNWGWEAQKTTQTVTSTNIDRILPILNIIQSEREVSMSTEFKVSETMVLKSSQGAVNMNHPDNLSILNEDIFSIFYSPSNNTPHFVLFGMQWCQPVWDGIEDPQGELVAGSCNVNSYIQNPEYANLNMHIVTRHMGGGNGKTYGTTRHKRTTPEPRDYRPEAVDIYSAEIGESPHFAVHGGTASGDDSAPSRSRGRWVNLITHNQNGTARAIRYLHMHQIHTNVTGTAIAPNAIGGTASNYVMAGTILGYGGTTGFPLDFNGGIPSTAANNYQPPSYGPNHVHMDDEANAALHTRGILTNLNEIDPFNRKYLPSRSNTPLLFPCRCVVTLNAQNPANCNFSDNFANHCWAAIELKCPSLVNRTNAATDNQQIRVIQAQLRFLGYYNGALDGNAGTGESATRIAITKYKTGDTTGITGVHLHFLDRVARPRPVVVSGNDQYRINGQTRSEAFEFAVEFSRDVRGNIVANDTTATITPLLLQWLNLEAPLTT